MAQINPPTNQKQLFNGTTRTFDTLFQSEHNYVNLPKIRAYYDNAVDKKATELGKRVADLTLLDLLRTQVVIPEDLQKPNISKRPLSPVTVSAAFIQYFLYFDRQRTIKEDNVPPEMLEDAWENEPEAFEQLFYQMLSSRNLWGCSPIEFAQFIHSKVDLSRPINTNPLFRKALLYGGFEKIKLLNEKLKLDTLNPDFFHTRLSIKDLGAYCFLPAYIALKDKSLNLISRTQARIPEAEYASELLLDIDHKHWTVTPSDTQAEKAKKIQALTSIVHSFSYLAKDTKTMNKSMEKLGIDKQIKHLDARQIVDVLHGERAISFGEHLIYHGQYSLFNKIFTTRKKLIEYIQDTGSDLLSLAILSLKVGASTSKRFQVSEKKKQIQMLRHLVSIEREIALNNPNSSNRNSLSFFIAHLANKGILDSDYPVFPFIPVPLCANEAFQEHEPNSHNASFLSDIKPILVAFEIYDKLGCDFMAPSALQSRVGRNCPIQHSSNGCLLADALIINAFANSPYSESAFNPASTSSPGRGFFVKKINELSAQQADKVLGDFLSLLKIPSIQKSILNSLGRDFNSYGSPNPFLDTLICFAKRDTPSLLTALSGDILGQPNGKIFESDFNREQLSTLQKLMLVKSLELEHTDLNHRATRSSIKL